MTNKQEAKLAMLKAAVSARGEGNTVEVISSLPEGRLPKTRFPLDSSVIYALVNGRGHVAITANGAVDLPFVRSFSDKYFDAAVIADLLEVQCDTNGFKARRSTPDAGRRVISSSASDANRAIPSPDSRVRTAVIIPSAGMLNWRTDWQTVQAATAYSLPIKGDAPAPQFGGCLTSTQTWDDRVTQPATWKTGPLLSSPEEIIKQFREGRCTQALALVVSWGGMGRTSKFIYGERKPETIMRIERTLIDCAESIRESQSIADSWRMLTGSGWSAVITSKTLHFLCRSLGFAQNPPAAIDGGVIREKVWPAFCKSIPVGQRPADWQGNTFEAYCRYMTAILTWAAQRNWTTTQVEATIFAEYN